MVGAGWRDSKAGGFQVDGRPCMSWMSLSNTSSSQWRNKLPLNKRNNAIQRALMPTLARSQLQLSLSLTVFPGELTVEVWSPPVSVTTYNWLGPRYYSTWSPMVLECCPTTRSDGGHMKFILLANKSLTCLLRGHVTSLARCARKLKAETIHVQNSAWCSDSKTR